MGGIIKDKKKIFVVAGVITALYAFLYVLLQLNEAALLTGSIVLFVALFLVMRVTRGAQE
jgi:inner membrane protein